MTGKGVFSLEPSRVLRRMFAIQVAWLAVVLVMGVWWGILILRLAEKVYALERELGRPGDAAAETWAYTRRVILWESGAFFALLGGLLAFLFITHWRELARARALQAFFASLTHELRTPLTSIRLQAESILERTGGGGESAKLFDRMLEDVSRLEGQVNQTLELARLEGGGSLFVQPVELRTLLERLASHIRPLARQPLLMRLPEGEEEIWIQADEAALETVFRNLVENALRHGAKPECPGLRLEVSARIEGDSLELRVQDDGPGTTQAPETLGKLFEKGPSSRGAGVGLYLVRTLVERMGGSARFGNAPEGGFEARLLLRRGGAA